MHLPSMADAGMVSQMRAMRTFTLYQGCNAGAKALWNMRKRHAEDI